MLTKRFSFDLSGLRKDKIRFDLDDLQNQQQQTTTNAKQQQEHRQPKILARCLSLGRLFCPSQGREKSKYSSNSSRRPGITFLAEEDEKTFSGDVTLDSALDFTRLVQLPAGLDINEWLATHAVAFFYNTSALCEALSDFCCPQSCATLTGPGNSCQVWTDERGRKCKYPASRYIDLATTLIQRLIQSEREFPTKFGNNFPLTFEATVKSCIMTQLCRILCHVCHAHWHHVIAIGMTPHLTALVRHFVTFSALYRLVRCEELDQLSDLYRQIVPALSLAADARSREMTDSNDLLVTAGNSSNSRCHFIIGSDLDTVTSNDTGSRDVTVTVGLVSSENSVTNDVTYSRSNSQQHEHRQQQQQQSPSDELAASVRRFSESSLVGRVDNATLLIGRIDNTSSPTGQLEYANVTATNRDNEKQFARLELSLCSDSYQC